MHPDEANNMENQEVNQNMEMHTKNQENNLENSSSLESDCFEEEQPNQDTQNHTQRHSLSTSQCTSGDIDADNWAEEGQVIPRQLLLVSFGLLMYIVDVGTDIKVAVDHYSAGDHLWAMWTLILALVPSIVMQLVSSWWFNEDKLLTPKIVFFHVTLLGPVVRYLKIIWLALSIRKNPKPEIQDYKQLVYQKLDCAMLNLFLAFMEDAPQLVLQLYIKARLQHDIEFTRIRDLWLIASLFLSMISLTWSLLNYYKSLRSSYRAKVQISGLISIFFWRFFTVSSRVITLALFASLHKSWLFALFGCHFLIMSYFISWQNICFFEGKPLKQRFLKFLLAYVLFFSYFSIEGKKTFKWAMQFYIIIGLENVSLILLWYFQQNSFTQFYSIFVLVYVIAAFLLGVGFMSLYYSFCHPSHVMKYVGGCKFDWRNRTPRYSRRNTTDSCLRQTHILSGAALAAQYLSVV